MHVEASTDRPDPDQRNYEVAFDKVSQLGFATRVPIASTISQVGSVARMVDDARRWRFVP